MCHNPTILLPNSLNVISDALPLVELSPSALTEQGVASPPEGVKKPAGCRNCSRCVRVADSLGPQAEDGHDHAAGEAAGEAAGNACPGRTRRLQVA